LIKNIQLTDPHTVQAAMDPNFAAYSGAFGGWTAAHALSAALTHTDSQQPALSLTIDFIKGIREGQVQSIATIIGTTRSAKFIRVDTAQGANLCASSAVVLADKRQTQSIAAIAMPTCAAPETLKPLSLPMNQVTWFEQLDMRFAQGQLLKPNPRLQSLVWTKLKVPTPMSQTILAGLADASFPRIYFHFNAPTPIATVTMTVYFHASQTELENVGDDFVLVDAASNIATHGFFDQTVNIWARNGTLLATSTQVVRYDV
jgi:acyl-CoA thioesterase